MIFSFTTLYFWNSIVVSGEQTREGSTVRGVPPKGQTRRINKLNALVMIYITMYFDVQFCSAQSQMVQWYVDSVSSSLVHRLTWLSLTVTEPLNWTEVVLRQKNKCQDGKDVTQTVVELSLQSLQFPVCLLMLSFWVLLLLLQLTAEGKGIFGVFWRCKNV